MKVGVDIGRSGVKAVKDGVRLFGLPTLARLPENQAWLERSSLDRLIERDGLVYMDSWQLRYGGEDWLIGERAERLGLPARHVMTVGKADQATRLLVLAALTALDSSIVVEACVGLPLHRYEEEGLILQGLVRGEHRVVAGGRERSVIVKGSIVPEGLGLWLRAATPDGSLPDRRLLGMETVVLDFGHRTIQMAVFSGLRMHPKPYVSAHGSYEVWEEALIEELEGRGQTVYESPQRALLMTELLRDGQLTVRGQRVTMEMIRPRLRSHAERIWPRLREEIRRTLEQVPYKRVVAGGGGIHIFEDLLVEFLGDDGIILRDRFAQAEGYRLFLEHRGLLESVA